MRKDKKPLLIAAIFILTLFALNSCGGKETTEKTNWSASEIILPESFSIDSFSASGDVLTLEGYSDDGSLSIYYDTSDSSFRNGLSGQNKLATFTSPDFTYAVNGVYDGDAMSDIIITKLSKKGSEIVSYKASELFGVDMKSFGGDYASGEKVFRIIFAFGNDDGDYIVSNTGAAFIGKNGEVVLVESKKELTDARFSDRLFVSDVKTYEVDFMNGEFVEPEITPPDGYNFSLDGYDIASVSGGVVSGFSLVDSEYEKTDLFEVSFVGIPGKIVSAASVGEDIYLLTMDTFSIERSLWKVSRCEADEKLILTLGIIGYYGDPATNSAIAEFNRTNENYRIRIKQYQTSDRADYTAEVEAFEKELIKGEIPDIILISPEYADIENYEAKGVFAPLDNGDDLLISDGFTIPVVASVNTYLGRESDFPDRLTLEALLDKLYELDDDEALIYDMRFSELLNFSLYEFVKDGSVDFDSELFKRFATAYKELGDRYHSDAIETSDRFASLANGEVLLSRESLTPEILAKYKLQYGVSNIADLGGQSLSIKLSIGVSEKSPYRDGAFEFLKLRTSEKYLVSRFSEYFPVATRSALEAYIESKPAYIYMNGDSFTSSDTKPYGEYIETSGYLDALIDSVTSARRQTRREKLILNVIMEELGSWKSRGGELDKATEIITDRVTTLISEGGYGGDFTPKNGAYVP